MTEQLNVNLSHDITYVSGTVNGEVADFSLTSPGVWSAIVPKAPDGKYVIEITAYNNLGSSTEYRTTIYKLDELMPVKTDWTSEDYYNAEDLNRVEANTQFVAEFLESIDYRISLETIKTDRDAMSIEFISSINRVESNLEALRASFLTPPGYQARKVWAIGIGFDYRDANRLEQNLKLLYEWGLIAKENRIFCGTFACGEEGVIY